METFDAVVLAGGLGTRIRHLHPDVPKPLVTVAGRPFLEWVLRWVAGAGAREVVISAGYKAEAVADFASRFDRVRVVAEPSPIGTGGGFLQAIAGSDADAWLVCNGDSIVFADLAAFIDAIPDDAVAALIAVRQEGDRYGRLAIDADGNLTAFSEKGTSAGPINAGVYFFRRAALRHFPDERPLSLERDVFPRLVPHGVRVVTVDAPFLDIGTEESLQQADAFIEQHRERFRDLPHL